MKVTFKKLLTVTAIACALSTPVSVFAAELPNNLRLVIGSKSTGGDTYQNSSIVAKALAEKLGINIKVDAVGSTAAFKALGRDKRGTTMMIFHDQAYLGHIYGKKGYKNIFSEYTVGPTVAINPGNAYAVPKSSPYKNMTDIFAAAASGKKIRVAIQPGGVSEIGFSAMKNASKMLNPGSEKYIVAVNTGGQSDKNQLLFDGQADVINASVQANEQYTQLPESDQKAMRFVWLTAREKTLAQANPKGMGATDRAALLNYATPKTSVTLDKKIDFSFDKEFFFLFNKEMDPSLITKVDNALKEIYAAGEIQKIQKKSFFIPNYLPTDAALAHLTQKHQTYKDLIGSITEK